MLGDNGKGRVIRQLDGGGPILYTVTRSTRETRQTGPASRPEVEMLTNRSGIVGATLSRD